MPRAHTAPALPCPAPPRLVPKTVVGLRATVRLNGSRQPNGMGDKHQSRFLSWARGTLYLLGLLLWVGGCNKPLKPVPPAPVVKTPTTLIDKPQVAKTTQRDAKKALRKLQESYHLIRCTLIGARFAPEDLYKDAGFADGAAFSAAFSEAAVKNPRWAAQVIRGSLQRSCKQKTP